MKLLNFTEIKFQYTENVPWACLEFLTSLGVKNTNWVTIFVVVSQNFVHDENSWGTKLSIALGSGIWKVIEGCTLYTIWALVQWWCLNLQVAEEIINSFPHFHFFQEHKISALFIKKKKNEGDWESKCQSDVMLQTKPMLMFSALDTAFL